MMTISNAVNWAADLTVIALLIAAIRQFRTPRGAKAGNLAAALALLCALTLVIFRNGVDDTLTVVGSLLMGSVAGFCVARAVGMIQIPAMVAFQHGAGGIAAFLVSFLELLRRAPSLGLLNEISGILGLTLGALTFSGSMVAAVKLADKIRQTPQVLPAHAALLLVNLAAMSAVGLSVLLLPDQARWWLLLVQIALAAAFGILFSIRIGGADMPVLISFLNAAAGFAAALCGMVIENQLLIAFGATVAASGSILTHVMAQAMNRNLLRIFMPYTAVRRERPEENPPTVGLETPQTLVGADGSRAASASVFEEAAAIVRDAKAIIIVPGYGMARAQAQLEVAAFGKKMIELGKRVKYAVHPVAGRMPGHMNVLLAEAGVDYDLLAEMEAVNPEFPSTDLVLVVGACDVVNPAAIEVPDTPLSGMPILHAHLAKNVLCCNYDDQPGYSGVRNPLYEDQRTILLAGDAKENLRRLLGCMGDEKPAAETPAPDAAAAAVDALAGAKNVVIVPGYGMALAQAQYKVAALASLLEERGATVKFAIHPVAGRMPGHMNVILAEAEVGYESLLEMAAANPRFSETDVVLIVGACDVVNPAAINMEGTPISGMPILMAHEAKSIIVCNFDKKPGYSGVANPLYDNPKTLLMLGDAKKTAGDLVHLLRALPN